ncbi:aKG-HExxH-type peptide beta-hydroxylase [Actinomadura nitritigenes]|uniref:aKG-HExxH-type peptide beta-hydroxylase n=1 Tax=Actinomadura nitritigenes TaxID=134602 RepID=UPI00368CA888
MNGTAPAITCTDPLADLGGLPFVDDGFRSRRLLAAAAAARHVLAERQGRTRGLSERTLEGWLAPARALTLVDGPAMPARPLTRIQRGQVAQARAGLAAAVPAWRPLLDLPVRYALLDPDGGAISASSKAWPQHVLLARAAFDSPLEVREQLLHETAHQWLYLIEEVWRLQRPGAARRTLPSGTADRSPAEVLGAAHVATALTRMYRACGDAPPGRLAHLAVYRAGCLDLLDRAAADLTDIGRAFVRRLQETA